MVSIRTVGADEYLAAARVFNNNPDRALKRELYKEFRAIGKPIGAKVVAEGSAEMPRHGGLAARVAASKVGQSNSTTGRTVGVALRFKTAPSATGQSYDLKAMDEGNVRHPVFARPGVKKVWRVTRVTPGAFTGPFEASRAQGAAAALRAMETVAAEAARRTTK
jgi:hypothetical protein